MPINKANNSLRRHLSLVSALVFLLIAIYLPTVWCKLYGISRPSSISIGGYRIELDPGWAPLQAKGNARTEWLFLNSNDKEAVAFIKDRFPIPLTVRRLTVFKSETGMPQDARYADYFSSAEASFGRVKVLKRSHHQKVLGESIEGEVVFVDTAGLTIHLDSLESLQEIKRIFPAK